MMEQDSHDTARIDRFLRGEMEGEALRAFGEQMQADPELLRAVEQRKRALAVIAVAGREAMRDRLRDIHREMEEDNEASRPPRRRFNRMFYWSSAAAILLLLIPLYILLRPSPSTPQELFAEYFQPQTDRAFSGDRAGGDPEFRQAMAFFQDGQYATAEPVLRDRAARFPDSLNLRLLHGVCLLGMGETGSARQELEVLLNRPPHYLREAAEWYTALAEIRDGHPQTAIPFLKRLTESQSRTGYQEEAREILEELE